MRELYSVSQELRCGTPSRLPQAQSPPTRQNQRHAMLSLLMTPGFRAASSCWVRWPRAAWVLPCFSSRHQALSVARNTVPLKAGSDSRLCR